MKTPWSAVLIMILAMPAAGFGSDAGSLIRGNTRFAVELYRVQARESGGNVIISPYSVSAVMALAGAGARGGTGSEIENAFRFPFGGARLAQAWKVLREDVGRKRPELELVTANALWAAKDVQFHPQYLALARDEFGAMLETVDFARPDAARQRINDWISEVTHEKIPALIGPGLLAPSSRLVLTNAIYMKAEWQSKFPPGRTNENGRFRTPAGERKAALMRNRGEFRYGRTGSVRIIELPYRGSALSMVVVLPDEVNGLADVETMLSAEKLAEWDALLAPALVDLTLPRFGTDVSTALSRTLRSMGIRVAFSAKADFSGIAKEPLMISEVIHQARIDVGEEGTEAAAATAALMPAGAAPPRKQPVPEVFNADHPFLYLIRRSDTKSVLFIGRLVQP